MIKWKIDLKKFSRVQFRKTKRLEIRKQDQTHGGLNKRLNVIGASVGDIGGKGNIKELTAENVPKLLRETNPQVQEAGMNLKQKNKPSFRIIAVNSQNI